MTIEKNIRIIQHWNNSKVWNQSREYQELPIESKKNFDIKQWNASDENIKMSIFVAN